MSKLSHLYQQVILDHSKKPRNFIPEEEEAPSDFTHQCEGRNPLCGDDIVVYLLINEDGIVQDIKFKGSGCSISQASASLMTQSLIGKSETEAKQIFKEFIQMITGELTAEEASSLGKLTVLAGVKEYPSRVKCASLAWHTMNGALQSVQEVSTE